jgi:hypothetical protein
VTWEYVRNYLCKFTLRAAVNTINLRAAYKEQGVQRKSRTWREGKGYEDAGNVSLEGEKEISALEGDQCGSRWQRGG